MPSYSWAEFTIGYLEQRKDAKENKIYDRLEFF